MFHFNKDCFRVQYSRKGTLLSENQLLECSWTDGWVHATDLGPATDHWQVSLAKGSVFCSCSQCLALPHISIIYGKQVKYNRRCPVAHNFLSHTTVMSLIQNALARLFWPGWNGLPSVATWLLQGRDTSSSTVVIFGEALSEEHEFMQALQCP